jgi:hypothetical protein
MAGKRVTRVASYEPLHIPAQGWLGAKTSLPGTGRLDQSVPTWGGGMLRQGLLYHNFFRATASTSHLFLRRPKQHKKIEVRHIFSDHGTLNVTSWDSPFRPPVIIFIYNLNTCITSGNVPSGVDSSCVPCPECFTPNSHKSWTSMATAVDSSKSLYCTCTRIVVLIQLFPSNSLPDTVA